MIATAEAGRDAVRRHSWTEAVEAFTAVDQDATLAPDDLELLGTATWWSGQPGEATDALERAFGGYSDAGRDEDAARTAITLAYLAFRRLEESIALGWVARAERILDALPDSPLHAWPLAFGALGALVANHIEEGLALADRAIDVARERGNTDALFMAMSFRGMGRLETGDWQTGLRDIDEAAAAATSGQLDIRFASDIFCTTIAACRSLGDLARAGQWTNEGERWMVRNGVAGYPGICRIHRAELKMLRGQWPEAEQEARQACDELERFGLLDSIGWGHYQIGEVRLRMGDLDAAGEAFDRAYEYGHDAQPGLALLQLARGEVAEAGRSIGRALEATSVTGNLADRARRGQLLPAQVDIALAAGDLATAARAVDELESIAGDFDRPLFQANALTARGELLLDEDRPADASPILGQSWRLWQSTNLPYESARARVRYAQALMAEGDVAAARRDLGGARATFERLGATRDVRAIEALLGGDEPTRAEPPRRATRTFMFTDIVTSTDLVGLLGDEAWGALLRWHDRELRSAIARHGGVEVGHTGDGFFAAFERPADGVEAAIDIQRRLVRHRREHGFAPWIRIGLHTAEATRDGTNYRGRGVHLAARVGAAAEREEILVSSAVVEGLGAGRFSLSGPRTLALKGIREPVEVRSIDWR